MSEAATAPVILAEALTKRFTEGRLDVSVLRGVDLQVHRGDTLAIQTFDDRGPFGDFDGRHGGKGYRPVRGHHLQG